MSANFGIWNYLAFENIQTANSCRTLEILSSSSNDVDYLIEQDKVFFYNEYEGLACFYFKTFGKVYYCHWGKTSILNLLMYFGCQWIIFFEGTLES